MPAGVPLPVPAGPGSLVETGRSLESCGAFGCCYSCVGPSILGGLCGASVSGVERLPAVCAAGAGLRLGQLLTFRCSVCNKCSKAKDRGPCGFAIGEAMVYIWVYV